MQRIKQYFFVIKELTEREIKRKYARSSLGIIWSILNPLLMMVVMSMIFSTMFKRSIDNYPIYYLTGQMVWELFSGATNAAMTALVDNKTLLIKAKLPRHTFVVSRIYTSLVNFGFTCVAYILMIILFGIKPSLTMLLFPVGMIFALIMSIGVGFILSTEYVFYADVKYLYGLLLRIVMYLSAIFYPADLLSGIMQQAIKFNPIYLLIYFFRQCVMYGQIPEDWVWIRLSVWSAIFLFMGLIVFKKQENRVMQTI